MTNRRHLKINRKPRAGDLALPNWFLNYERVAKTLVSLMNVSVFYRQKRLAKLTPARAKNEREAIAQKLNRVIEAERSMRSEDQELADYSKAFSGKNREQANQAAQHLYSEATRLAYALEMSARSFPELFVPIACESSQWPVLVSPAKPSNTEADFCLPYHPLAFLHSHKLWSGLPTKRKNETLANGIAAALAQFTDAVKEVQGSLVEFPLKVSGKRISLAGIIGAQLLQDIVTLPALSIEVIPQYRPVCRAILDLWCGRPFQHEADLIPLGLHRSRHTKGSSRDAISVWANIRDGIWKRIEEALKLIAKKGPYSFPSEAFTRAD